MQLKGRSRSAALAGLVSGFLFALEAPSVALTLVGEKCTGVFAKLITVAGTIKPDDIVAARQMRLACLTLMQLANTNDLKMQQLFCADEAAQAREACKIADAVIETYEAARSTQINPR